MEHSARLLDSARPTAIGMMFGFSFMTALELLLPRRQLRLKSRLHGLIYWIIWIPVTAVSFALFHLLWAALGIPPLIVLPLTFSWAGVFAAAILAALAGGVVGGCFFC